MPWVPTHGIFLYSILMLRADIPELALCTGVILYTPHFDEIDPLQYTPITHIEDTLVIPCDAKADVVTWVKTCTAILGHKKNVCVFLPGTAFDIYGTRRGRGGGWYDRFLSLIPKEWVRIGVATSEAFKDKETLTRQSWDEPVDYTIVYDTNIFSWSVFEVFPRRSV